MNLYPAKQKWACFIRQAGDGEQVQTCEPGYFILETLPWKIRIGCIRLINDRAVFKCQVEHFRRGVQRRTHKMGMQYIQVQMGNYPAGDLLFEKTGGSKQNFIPMLCFLQDQLRFVLYIIQFSITM